MPDFFQDKPGRKMAGLITIVIVVSVFLYMDLLVRRNRDLMTKQHHAQGDYWKKREFHRRG